jgi:ComF family protein
LFQYSSLIPKKALFAFKYDFFLGAYTPFLPLIETALFEYPELQSYDIAIPIPLHRARLHERGFNQSEIIAQTFASLSRPPLPVVSTLSRIRNTKHQADIHSREEREKNISGAFKSLPYIPDHASLVLVDDVFTTGATTEEAIRTLRALHPKKILIFTLFRGE